ncbi:hypothetical protein BJ741DRAFT_636384 [Chytriomyces cf. hyalinus JEL632]|nr:hypothetical protein BJ741DRAFT_636384 [Chytriomyces cf. hyalinus JEL632]
MLSAILSRALFCWMNALTVLTSQTTQLTSRTGLLALAHRLFQSRIDGNERFFPAFVCFPWCRAVLARSSCTMPRSACTMTSNLLVSPVAHLDTKTRAQVCIYVVLSTENINS